MSRVYQSLQQVIEAEMYPQADTELRRGRHIGRDDGPLYDYLSAAMEYLEPMYQRFGAELIQRSDGYIFLLPSGDWLGRTRLSAAEMLVGQVLALLYLDPATLQSGGKVTRQIVLDRLSAIFGDQSLFKVLNPKRKRENLRAQSETVREEVDRALRELAKRGFIASEGADFRLYPALMRFVEPVRAAASLEEAMERLIKSGEVEVDDETESGAGNDGDLI